MSFFTFFFYRGKNARAKAKTKALKRIESKLEDLYKKANPVIINNFEGIIRKSIKKNKKKKTVKGKKNSSKLSKLKQNQQVKIWNEIKQLEQSKIRLEGGVDGEEFNDLMKSLNPILQESNELKKDLTATIQETKQMLKDLDAEDEIQLALFENSEDEDMEDYSEESEEIDEKKSQFCKQKTRHSQKKGGRICYN